MKTRNAVAQRLTLVFTPRLGTAQFKKFASNHAFTGGEVITKAGTTIAHDAGHAVVTPHDDCVLVMPSVRQLRPGFTVVRLGQLI